MRSVSTVGGKTTKSERASAARTIKSVAPYLWPDEHPWVKRRVVLAMVALVMAKIISVLTPFLYKAAVDSLSGEMRDDSMLLLLGGRSP